MTCGRNFEGVIFANISVSSSRKPGFSEAVEHEPGRTANGGGEVTPYVADSMTVVAATVDLLNEYVRRLRHH